jgi:multidrug resistance protein MdtO
VFILPYLDSIAGFTILFVVVTGGAAWIMTSSPRLSYFGLQLALAFYLINLQEFAIQTSLAVARDRVVGVLLGLFMMWLVFDRLWGASAGVEMKKTFISNLRLLAQYIREPLSKDLRAAIARSFSIRETINNSFDQVRALADGVLFEFGPSRERDLAIRSRIFRVQPQLRTLFLTRITLWKYRAQLPGFELPEAVGVAEQEFDRQLAKTLDGMADSLEGKAQHGKESFANASDRLEEAVRRYRSEGPPGSVTDRLQTFLTLSRNIESLTTSLEKEI